MADPLILLVEDDADIRQLFHDSLELRNFEVETTDNGQAALEILAQATRLPSVIVADLHMPVMDGWELLTRLAEDPRLAGIPVVVLTAANDANKSAPRPSAMLIKPVSIDDLVAAITSAMGPAP